MAFEISQALLFDESTISMHDQTERQRIYETMVAQGIGPKLRYLQYLQPQGGCYNNCVFCSQDASPNVWELKLRELRNFISALKVIAAEYSRISSASRKEVAFKHADMKRCATLGQAREHRTGQVFCYLDNDPMSYRYLDFLIESLGRDFGVKTRISTVGFSRKNPDLDNMHSYISQSLGGFISGLRFSVTPYTSQWKKHETETKLRKNPFALDLAYSLRTYRTLFEKGLNHSKDEFSIELRTAPLVWRGFRYHTSKSKLGHNFVSYGPLLIVQSSPNEAIPHKDAATVVESGYSKDVFGNSVCLMGDPLIGCSDDELSELADEFINDPNQYDAEVYEETATSHGPVLAKRCSTVWLQNSDGPYLCIDGLPSDNNRYRNEINVYAPSETREAGVVYRRRHLLASIIDFRKQVEPQKGVEWEDIDGVFARIDAEISAVRPVCKSVAEHLLQDVVPLARLVAFAMSEAGFPASDFLERGVFWDTGPITNSGRAMTSVFKGLTNSWYQPMSLGEEFGYGRHSASQAGQRQVVLRLSPVPGSRPKNFERTAGFRSNFENLQSGMVAEELDAFIQPIPGSKRLIPMRVDTAHGIRFGKSHYLLPGVS